MTLTLTLTLIGGLAYSFSPDGTPCDWDKIFWVQCEAIGTAAMLATETGKDEYWEVHVHVK